MKNESGAKMMQTFAPLRPKTYRSLIHDNKCFLITQDLKLKGYKKCLGIYNSTDKNSLKRSHKELLKKQQIIVNRKI